MANASCNVTMERVKREREREILYIIAKQSERSGAPLLHCAQSSLPYLLCLNSIHNTVTVPLLPKFHSLKLHLYSEKKPRANVRLNNRKVSKNRKTTPPPPPPLQLGTQEYDNTQKNLLAIVASQPFYKTLVITTKLILLLTKSIFYKFILKARRHDTPVLHGGYNILDPEPTRSCYIYVTGPTRLTKYHVMQNAVNSITNILI